MLLYKSLFAITLKLQKHKHIGIKENAEILVQCYCISSNNSRPSIIASLEYPPPPAPLAVFSSWSRQVQVQCDPSKLISDELIKELNLEHLKSHVQFIWCDYFWI